MTKFFPAGLGSISARDFGFCEKMAIFWAIFQLLTFRSNYYQQILDLKVVNIRLDLGACVEIKIIFLWVIFNSCLMLMKLNSEKLEKIKVKLTFQPIFRQQGVKISP